MIPTRNVPEVLGRARDLVAPAHKAAIELLSPELRPVAEYHLGWIDENGKPVGGDGGKGVRPALAVLSAEAVGADAMLGVPGAVAVELVHNFSLIHDDVIDGDTERRHRQTVWALYGIGRAVIVGDAMLALAQQVILDAALLQVDLKGASASIDTTRAARLLADATAAMIAGQALDMAFETLPTVDVEGCLAMEAGKTGALLGCAASIGAALAGAPEQVVHSLDRFGVELGLAFQAIDDLLGIWGDPVKTGKQAWSDLYQRKKSLPVVAALAAGTTHSEELAELLVREQFEAPEVARAAELVELCGGRTLTAEEADRHLDLALKTLESTDINDQAKSELLELADFVVERQF